MQTVGVARSRTCAASDTYVNDKVHGTATLWRADGAVGCVEEWVHGVWLRY